MAKWQYAIVLSLLLTVAGSAQIYDFNYASTAAEGYQQGMASVITSAGAKNLMDSAAAKNYAQARSAEIDNRMKYTKTYFDMKDVNQAYQDKTRLQPLSSEQAARWAAAGAPKMLSSSDLDPVTGTIDWPTLLRDPRYDADRAQIETLFNQRASSGGAMGYELYRPIVDSIKAFQSTLETNINDYPQQAFLASHRFLDSLAYEARRPM